ncbi:PAS domain S-box protein [Herbaspirillum sp. HC18]|nr:PAS domain S-box protein [Herbaspirillum sp. HC18]
MLVTKEPISFAGDGTSAWQRIPRSPWQGLLSALAMVAVIAVLDYISGYEVRLAILYLLPIALATWSGGIPAGTVVSIAAAVCWSVSFHPNHIYSREIYYYWEATVLVVTFIIFMLLLDRLRKALARADKRLLHVLEGLTAGIYAVDERSGKVLYSNRRFAEMFGEDPGAMHAQTFERNLHISSSTSKTHEVGNERSLFHYHQARDERNGQWYLVQSAPISWEGGARVQLNVLMDITEQKQAATLKRQHREMLHDTARLTVLAEIASMLGHEINQPLMAIATYNDASIMLLAKENPDLAEVVAALEKSRAQAIRASRIVERTRGFLRRRAPSHETGSINEIVRCAVDSMDVELQSGNIAIELDLADTVPDIVFDRTLIEQVIVNLTRNAIDAVRSARPSQREILIRTEGNGHGAILFSVSDNGDGILPATAERLYTPFFTTKPQGLGLGLCICRSVIEAHAGCLWHEPRPGGGTSFYFTLPLQGGHSQ